MTKGEQVRLVTWRSKILQHAAGTNRSVAHTCRCFGISRKTFYKWANRHRSHGDAGLCDRPRAARRFPGATPLAVVSKILYLRQQYHFGAGRISAYLRRFHQVSVARSTVHRLLNKHGLGRLPANQKHRPRTRWQRYEDDALVAEGENSLGRLPLDIRGACPTLFYHVYVSFICAGKLVPINSSARTSRY